MDFNKLSLMNDFHYELPKMEPVEYKNTLFKEMSDDIKSSYTDQLNKINGSLTEQIDIAKKESKGAKREALISKIFSIIAIFISIVAIVIPLLNV